MKKVKNFGGCEKVNRYIHGGNGIAEQAAAPGEDLQFGKSFG